MGYARIQSSCSHPPKLPICPTRRLPRACVRAVGMSQLGSSLEVEGRPRPCPACTRPCLVNSPLPRLYSPLPCLYLPLSGRLALAPPALAFAWRKGHAVLGYQRHQVHQIVNECTGLQCRSSLMNPLVRNLVVLRGGQVAIEVRAVPHTLEQTVQDKSLVPL